VVVVTHISSIIGDTEVRNKLILEAAICYDSATCKFKTTEKGLQFLEVYSNIDDVMREEGE
jgi:hypothetical protein